MALDPQGVSPHRTVCQAIDAAANQHPDKRACWYFWWHLKTQTQEIALKISNLGYEIDSCRRTRRKASTV